MELFNDNCFNIFPQIQDNYVDLFVLDLPYANKKFGNCTACRWDTPIDLKKMWEEIKRIMKPNATIIFFCNTKFGWALIDSNPKWFKYDLIWKKSRKVGFLSANKMPLRQHENIYIFGNEEDDIEIVKNKQLREYSKNVLEYINKNKKDIINKLGQGLDHFFRHSSSQFALPIEKNYNKLIQEYKIDKMQDFKTYEELKSLEQLLTYNPQKTEGTPYKTKGKGKCEVYDIKRIDNINNGDRHPSSIIEMEAEHENIYIFKDKQGTYNAQKIKLNTDKNNEKKDLGMIKGGYYRGEGQKPFKRMPNDPTTSHPTSIIEMDNTLLEMRNTIQHMENTILEYKNPTKTIHRTQKPVDLLEWLIKSYSNEGDVVMDFCMGSGTAGVAAQNLNRKFIGVEMDKEIFDKAYKRIKE